MTVLIQICLIILLLSHVMWYCARVAGVTSVIHRCARQSKYSVLLDIPRYWYGRATNSTTSNKVLAMVLLPPAGIGLIFFVIAICLEPSIANLFFAIVNLYFATIVLSVTYGPNYLRFTENGIHWHQFVPWDNVVSFCSSKSSTGVELLRVEMVRSRSTNIVTIPLGGLTAEEQDAVNKLVEEHQFKAGDENGTGDENGR